MAKPERKRRRPERRSGADSGAGWSWPPYAAVILAAILAHSPGLTAPFQFDDLSLPGDPAIGRADGWLEILTDPARTRPLTYLTYWANERWAGFDPSSFHAVNLALFIVLLVLAATLYRRLVPAVAAVGALAIVALHPLQTEAVTYIFARATLLAAIFCVLAWHDWIAERRWRAVVWFVLAMLSKEEAASLPVFLAGYELFWRRTSLRPALPQLSAMVAIVAASAARLFYAIEQTPGSGAGAEAAGVSAWSYLLTQGRAVWLYLRLLVAPYGQTIDRDWTASAGLDSQTVAAWLGLFAMVGAGVWLLRRYPEAYWWLGGLLLLGPTSSLIPLADLTAERRMTLPLLSLSLGVGLLLQRLPSKAAVAALLVGSTAMGGLTWRRAQVWTSEETLWRDAVEKAPDKVRPKLQLARALEMRGVASEVERLELLEQARALEPKNSVPLAELGVFYLRRNDPARALEAFERAQQLAPEDPQIRANIGSSLWLLRRPSESVEAFRTALALEPCNFDARSNLLLVLRAMGATSELSELASAPPDCRFSAAQRESLEKSRP